MRKCGKFLGFYDLVIGNIYCKSCGQMNYYEVVTEKGLQKGKTLW
jgi:hypothetical protein